MNYKASVIIPVYNAEKTLEKCAESVLYGKERNVQVILIDDCSDDGSWSICECLAAKHKNVIALQNAKNRGVSAARNRGLQEAAGEFVLFADSDDWVSGKFAAELIEAAEKAPNEMVVCGFHFEDRVHGYGRDYLWEGEDSKIYHVPENQYFDLVDRVLIQSVWNKIFRTDVIRKHNLSFDANQNMGEDFQFVLDYMKVSGTKGCLVINCPLYYYIRYTSTSLMGQLGLTGYEESVNRLTQLAELSGQLNTKAYQEQIEIQQKNFQYQIVHAPNLTRKEKTEKIEAVMRDGKASAYYRTQSRIIAKENILKTKADLIRLQRRAAGWRQRKKRDRLIRTMRGKVKETQYTIFSQNCIGGVFYHDMGEAFLSPTINLYFPAEDFVKFVLHLEEYLSLPLKMSWKESYPVGTLGDVTIYFQHYRSCTEAAEVWERRKKRIQWDRIVIFSTDREDFNDEVFRLWNQIPYPKVLFTAQKRYAQQADSVYFPEYEQDGFVPDLIPNREFYRNETLIDTINRMKD